jgi:hypothetical protein
MSQACKNKLDHVVESWAGLVGALDYEAGMAEADHCHMSAPGGYIDIVDCKLPLRNPIGHDAPVDLVDALNMAGDYFPALGHGTSHHLVHAQVRRIALRVEAVVGSSDFTEPLRGRPGTLGDAAQLGLDFTHCAFGDGLVDRLLRVEKAINIRGTHPERLGDVSDRGLLVADLPKQAFGRIDDLAPRFGLGVS